MTLNTKVSSSHQLYLHVHLEQFTATQYNNSLYPWASVGIESRPMILVFGCRQSEIDHIYKEETIQAKNKNVFKELYTAYSREPGKPKVLTADTCPEL